MNKKPLFLGIALLSCIGSASIVSARAQHVFFDDFLFDPWVEQLMSWQDAAVNRMKNFADGWETLKEDREAIKSARASLAKVKQELKDEKTQVVIRLRGFEGLEKKDVKIVKKDRGWLGTISLNEGRIEFFITAHGIQITRRVELKKESASTKKDAQEKSQQVVYSSSSATEVDYFTSAVDISTLQAQPIKPTELVLTVQKQKEEILPLS